MSAAVANSIIPAASATQAELAGVVVGMGQVTAPMALTVTSFPYIDSILDVLIIMDIDEVYKTGCIIVLVGFLQLHHHFHLYCCCTGFDFASAIKCGASQYSGTMTSEEWIHHLGQ